MNITIDTKKMMKKILEESNQDYNEWSKKTIEKNIGQIFDTKSKIRKAIDEMILEEEGQSIIEKYLKGKGIEL
ncbi:MULTISPECIES: hypothetical protein [Lactobacillales]|uniref:hypothetical protein n=1 Tax=Lactobacillales TaxID=186826 RepID=UPI002223637F|nr:MULTISPECIES: hypothetical protein [Lactobacillales]MDH5039480.1 hypothetical protein [Enterococcus faecalis]MDM7659978.1 hypothetical protein [Lactococcus lactis]UYY26357.1 hypothetical protein OLM01_14280 [Enterococcus faecalis]UYY42961.1 hypothetical protein OLL96_14295 [Enterococcus faecalis]HCR3187550.1 hypothetical protein [Enterococcus faecalis]